MLEFLNALEAMQAEGKKLASTKTEQIKLSQALGRVLSEDIHATIDVPPADNSAMDGWAYNSKDISEVGQSLSVSQRICAGDEAQPLQLGTAARIFTGAEIPAGADTVVMQENCSWQDKQNVIINKLDQSGANIRRRAQDIAQGSCILKAGQLLDARQIGLLASIGINKIKVQTRLRIALISTGDELIPAGKGPLKPGQIYDSNGPMLEAYARELGCNIVMRSHAPDDLQASETLFKEAAEKAELILSCGGVSVGEEDHVRTALENLGELDFWKIRIKPGKPLAYARLPKKDGGTCAFIGLPGNPVSAYVCCHLFASTLVRAMQTQQHCFPKSRQATSAFNIKQTGKRPEFIRVIETEKGLERYSNQSSGVLSSVAWADALALLPEQTEIELGQSLEIFPLS
ncbi:gephyrin-like molybdotransferase Glp [Agaribacterium sp. ZY112]|uniref:molybdopterin molybdotransferase MoeA n=1 Tax=Agaribacterium sp. ZY112 TaxID=3233574 RepID=UPI0035262126